jgi:hypothetical protein
MIFNLLIQTTLILIVYLINQKKGKFLRTALTIFARKLKIQNYLNNRKIR